MKDKYSDRIERVIEDPDGNLVIAIRKYRLTESLRHSYYVIVFLACIVLSLVLMVLGNWSGGIALAIVGLIFWGMAWLSANDRLKGCIYSELLEKHLLKNGLETEPFVLKRYHPNVNKIECICSDGTEKKYKVELMNGQSSMYVVKICTSAMKCFDETI